MLCHNYKIKEVNFNKINKFFIEHLIYYIFVIFYRWLNILIDELIFY